MYDLAIIGGGPGGYVAAIRGAQHGLNVLLIEKDTVGGTCLMRGCIPTKCLIYDSKLLREDLTSAVITGNKQLSIDPVKMLDRKRKVVNGMIDGLKKIILSHRIDLVTGKGELIGPGRLKVHLEDGSFREYHTNKVILATGSRPSVPPIGDVDGHFVQTTDEALDSEDIPRRVIIIGGGVIGMEMAAIYLNLGCEITIIELLPDILVTEDQEIRRAMRMLLDQYGASISLNSKVKEVAILDNQVKVSFESENGKMLAQRADRVLIAAGRQPLLDGIDIDRLDLEMEGPFIKVNSRLETSLPGVYAIGDLVGGMMLAHKASAEAAIVVANILGAKKEIKPEFVPRCIWGLTEIGAIGLTEAEARVSGRPIKVGKFPFSNSGAAQTMGCIAGFTKIVGDAETGEILGVHILGEHATDLIGEAVITKTMEAAVEDLAEAVRPHPTLSETVMEAAMDWSNLVIHSPKKR